jgi:serine protease Do
VGLRAAKDAVLAPIIPARAEAERPADWVVAVWRADAGATTFSSGLLQGRGQTRCREADVREWLVAFALKPEMAGGGLFDLNGDLLGVIVDCGARYSVISTESINAALVQAEGLEERILGRYGLKLTSLGAAEREYFDAEVAVLVSEVWKGYPGDEAGLEPGDVIESLDSEPVFMLHDLEKLVLPVAREFFDLAVRRGRRKQELVRLRKSRISPGLSWRRRDADTLSKPWLPVVPRSTPTLRPGIACSVSARPR